MTTLTVPSNVTTDTVHRVRPIIDDLRTFILSQRRHDRVYPELEIRLCREDTGGISEKAWMRLLSALDACTTWSGTTDTSEIVDFFYDADIQGETVPIRTAIHFSRGRRARRTPVQISRAPDVCTPEGVLECGPKG